MRPSADASAASTTSRRSVRLVLERRAEAVRPGHAGARRTEQHRAAHAGAVTPGRGRGGRDGADIGLSDAGCPAGARVAGAHGAALRRGPAGGVGERDGRGGTDVAISADRSGFSLWASRMASRSGRPPGCRASGPPSRGSGLRCGGWDWRWERLTWPWSAFRRAAGARFPRSLGGAQRRFPGLVDRPAAIAAFRKADEEPRPDSLPVFSARRAGRGPPRRTRR